MRSIRHIRAVLRETQDLILAKDPWFVFPTAATDGRTNSQQGESVVTDFLLNAMPGKLIKKASKTKKKASSTKKKASSTKNEASTSNSETEEDNRAFGDIAINMEAFEKPPFPCNVKLVGEANKAGNNACGLASLISYTFGKSCRDHESAMKVIIDIDRAGHDSCAPELYGLIMVQKENKKCWTGTFDEVPSHRIGTNPSNPLQVPFLGETERVSRTPVEYVGLLISKIVEYHSKKSEPFALWSAYQASKKAQ